MFKDRLAIYHKNRSAVESCLGVRQLYALLNTRNASNRDDVVVQRSATIFHPIYGWEIHRSGRRD